MESKNLSILLTDIQGYSVQTANSSRAALKELIDTHQSLLRPIIEFYRGIVVKTMGDAFLCTFESATDAAVCAIAIQMALQEHNRNVEGSKSRLNIRIMISSGDVTVSNSDVFGEAVNVVSRMEKLDEFSQGGIGITESTCLLMNRSEIVTELLGERQLKGISQPIKIYKIPLGRQNLDQFPGRLSDIKERNGKKFSEKLKLERKRTYNKVFYVLFVLVLLVVAFRVARNKKLFVKLFKSNSSQKLPEEEKTDLAFVPSITPNEQELKQSLARSACREIVMSCRSPEFKKNSGRNGIVKLCVLPVLDGMSVYNGNPLPSIDAKTIEACKKDPALEILKKIAR